MFLGDLSGSGVRHHFAHVSATNFPLFQWTQKWLLQFNKDKCKILHLGKNNPKYNYTIGEAENKVTLSETELEKDLGIYVDPNLDFKDI